MKKCGVILYNIDEEKYLLVHGKKSEKWGFPKGHMEIGESEIMTAQRELFEETGIQLSKHLFEKRIRYRNNIYFLIQMYTKEIPITEDPIPDQIEIMEMKWFSEQDIFLLNPNDCNFGLKSWMNNRQHTKNHDILPVHVIHEEQDIVKN